MTARNLACLRLSYRSHATTRGGGSNLSPISAVVWPRFYFSAVWRRSLRSPSRFHKMLAISHLSMPPQFLRRFCFASSETMGIDGQ